MMSPTIPRTPLYIRFRRFVVVPDDPDSCWGWTGATDAKGYGRIRRGGRGAGVCIASRVSYEIANGPIPDDICVLHRCDNPPCCNPAHLFLGTIAENNADMARKGRQRTIPQVGDENPARRFPERLTRGESQHLAKLTADSVRAIRAEHAEGILNNLQLAAKFRVNASTIGRVVKRQTWAHID